MQPLVMRPLLVVLVGGVCACTDNRAVLPADQRVSDATLGDLAQIGDLPQIDVGASDHNVAVRDLQDPGHDLPPCASPPPILAGPVSRASDGHHYYLLAESTWAAAETKAVALGGHLATINDEEENQWVFTTFSYHGGVGRGLWIGLTDQVNEGVFEWVDGSPLLFTRWAAGEPNNNGGNENWVYIFYPQDTAGRAPGWNDSPEVCGHDASGSGQGWIPINGVVEVSPSP